MGDLGKCDHCDNTAVVKANGRRGCTEHLDETFRPIGEQVRLIADLAHGREVGKPRD